MSVRDCRAITHHACLTRSRSSQQWRGNVKAPVGVEYMMNFFNKALIHFSSCFVMLVQNYFPFYKERPWVGLHQLLQSSASPLWWMQSRVLSIWLIKIMKVQEMEIPRIPVMSWQRGYAPFWVSYIINSQPKLLNFLLGRQLQGI